MPVSQGSAGGLPGLNLKAWAQVSEAGALVRGFNVSAAARPATGNYTVTLSSAVSAAAVCRLTMVQGTQAVAWAYANAGGVTCNVVSSSSAALANTPFYVEIYD